jgi:glycosyltransferase involved in cell wall biosynthesis
MHIPPGDVAALTATMETLAREPELRRELASAGHAKMTSQYTWKAVHSRLEEIYQLTEIRHL